MNIYTLYKKVDKNSGLHYLGMTTQDPYVYQGSGKYWKNHIETNQVDIETTIVFQTTSKKEFNDTGRYYSRLWNIVGAMDDFGNKIWANDIPETGGGPGWGRGKSNVINNPDTLQKMKNSRLGISPWNKGERGLQTAWNKGLSKSDKRIADASAKCSKTKKELGMGVGLSNPAADNNLYEFIHKDGRRETSTPYELRQKHNLRQSQTSMMMLGYCKSVKGWRLATPPTYKRSSPR